MNLLKLNTKSVGFGGILALGLALVGNDQIRATIGAAFTHPTPVSVLTAIGLVAGAAAAYYGRPATVPD